MWTKRGLTKKTPDSFPPTLPRTHIHLVCRGHTLARYMPVKSLTLPTR